MVKITKLSEYLLMTAAEKRKDTIALFKGEVVRVNDLIKKPGEQNDG